MVFALVTDDLRLSVTQTLTSMNKESLITFEIESQIPSLKVPTTSRFFRFCTIAGFHRIRI